MLKTISLITLLTLTAAPLAAQDSPGPTTRPSSSESDQRISGGTGNSRGWRSPTAAPSGNLLVSTPAPKLTRPKRSDPHALRDFSMFAIAPPEPQEFHEHDLVQIIVRESSKTKRSQDLDTSKDYKINGKISAFPSLRLKDLLDLTVKAGKTSDLPALNLGWKNEFTGEGEYNREDDMTDRLTAEIISVLPNGNLILEARTFIKTDEEESMMKVTGVCRPEDISTANSILSNLIHDLRIEKMHTGELKKVNEKGIISRVLEAIFAF